MTNGLRKLIKANVIIDVAVPASVNAEQATTDGINLLNKQDTICIYGSNQFSGEALINADGNLKKLGKRCCRYCFRFRFFNKGSY